MMDKEQIIEALKSHFPKRWFRYDGTGIQRLLEVIAESIYLATKAVNDVNREVYDGTAVVTLPDKERVFKLNVTSEMSIQERQKRLIARRWERGGPTNTVDFENSLSLLIGAPTKIIPEHNNFSMLLSFRYYGQKLNYPIIEEYLRRNKLGHLQHIYGPALEKETITLKEKVTVTRKEYHKVKEFKVGMTPIKWKGETILR